MVDQTTPLMWTRNSIHCGCCFLLIALCLMFSGCKKTGPHKDKIVIGVVYSISGPLSSIQRDMVNGITLAAEEINRSGGLLGKQIEIMTVDGKSDPDIHKKAAEDLIKNHGAVAILGGSTAVDRKALKTVVEKYNNILFFCGNYEGLEVSNNIVYMTLSPNQQLVSTVSWSVRNFGKRFFLVGMDDIYSHTVNEILKDYIFAFNGEVVGENYINLHQVQLTDDIEKIVDAIHASNPSVVINTLRGDHNHLFYKTLKKGGVIANSTPIISYWLTSNTAKSIGIDLTSGDYNIMDYFVHVNGERNAQFIEAYQNRFGKDAFIDAFVERAYASVYVWREAVANSKTTHPPTVMQWIRNNGVQEPGGLVFMNDHQHPYREIKIGKLNPSGDFDILWNSGTEVPPVNFPDTRSVARWQEFQNNLYRKWGEKWYR